MTVAHPPPMPPLFVEPEELTAPLTPAGTVVQMLRLKIHLHGFESLDAEAVEGVIQQALTPEALVLGLSKLVHASGLPLARVHYTVIDGHLHLLLKEYRYDGVSGDERLSRFFRATHRSEQFDPAVFERERVLAAAYSERTRQFVEPQFHAQPDGRVQLQLRSRQQSADRLTTQIDLNNHGSRFAGRNTAGIGFTLRSDAGGETQLGGRVSPGGMNDEESQGAFYEGSLGYSKITNGGIVGVNFRQVGFGVDDANGDAQLDGIFREAGVEWSFVALASPVSRSLIRLRASASDRYTDFVPSDERLFQERYGAVEFNPSYARMIGAAELSLGLSVIGLSALEQVGSQAADSLAVIRPQLRLNWSPIRALTLNLSGFYQHATDITPEAQQWTLGGPALLQALTPARLTGDRGHYFRGGLALNGGHADGWSAAFEPFYEQGQVSGGEDQQAYTESVSDAGIRLSLQWRRRFEINATAAQILSAGPALVDEDPIQIYGGLTLRF